MSHHRWIREALCFGLLLASLRAQPLQFTEVAATSGINWTQADGGFRMGAGGAFIDYDGDGDLDVLCVGGVGAIGLFRNEGNGLFSDQSTGSGLDRPPATFDIMGAVVGDYDGDGDPDVYICALGENLLFRNDGGGSFSDVTHAAGVQDARWSTTACFADYDGDGDADLFVGNYIGTPSFPFHTPDTNALYHNNGDGTFSDQAPALGVDGTGTALASFWFDDDDDGRLDLWVANDFGRWITPNRLWRNVALPGGGVGFTDVAPALGADAAIYCMGLTAADYDRDGDLDVYMSNLGPNVFYRNDGPFGFVDVASGTGTAFGNDPLEPHLLATSWGVGFHDFDNDGWMDLYVSNGNIPAANFILNGQNTPSALFHHQGPSLVYQEVAAAAGVADQGIGRGCAFGDYDRDGDVDIIQFNVLGSPSLFRNDTITNNHFLRLDLKGRQGHPDAQGARVRARLPGGVELVRDVNQNYSFESSSDRLLHFGLGTADRVERLRIRWPHGPTSTLHDLPADAEFQLLEPKFVVEEALCSAPTTIADGSLLNIDFAFRNRGASAGARVFFQIEVPGAPPVTSPLHLVPVTAGQVATRSFSFPIPNGVVPAGSSLPVRVTWTVFDTGLGFDQWRCEFDVTP